MIKNIHIDIEAQEDADTVEVLSIIAAKMSLKVVLTRLLEDIDKDTVTVNRYNRKVVIGPTESEWDLDFTMGHINIKHTSS